VNQSPSTSLEKSRTKREKNEIWPFASWFIHPTTFTQSVLGLSMRSVNAHTRASIRLGEGSRPFRYPSVTRHNGRYVSLCHVYSYAASQFPPEAPQGGHSSLRSVVAVVACRGLQGRPSYPLPAASTRISYPPPGRSSDRRADQIIAFGKAGPSAPRGSQSGKRRDSQLLRR
jgi:hypothetical protein